MPQVDENIGGRQDQKNNGLQTKTLAVGLLMVVGCFVVGFFNPTTTAMSPNVEGMVSNVQAYPYVTITNTAPYDTFPTKHGHVIYPYPGYDPSLYGGSVEYSYLPCDSGLCCDDQFVHNALAAGGTWTAMRRGLCLVTKITAALALPGLRDGLVCAPYTSSGTKSSQFSIRMDGHDACSVVRVVA